MTNTLIVIRMLLDLLTGGDPTLPSGHEELVPVAVAFATVRDFFLSLIGQ